MGKIIKNLLFPFINISLPIIFIIVISLNIEYFCFTLLIGIIMGGIVPLLLIMELSRNVQSENTQNHG